MDDFTRKHLLAFVERVLFEDERDDFVAWVEGSDPEELDYYMQAGWPAAVNAWRVTA